MSELIAQVYLFYVKSFLFAIYRFIYKFDKKNLSINIILCDRAYHCYRRSLSSEFVVVGDETRTK